MTDHTSLPARRGLIEPMSTVVRPGTNNLIAVLFGGRTRPLTAVANAVGQRSSDDSEFQGHGCPS
jgi:hypothetical protein